jgi:hypothetical protein
MISGDRAQGKAFSMRRKKIITGPKQFLKVVKEALYLLMHKSTIISAFFRKQPL